MDLLKKLSNLQDLKGNITGKKVFLRADFNVPIENGVITDTFRIDSTVETIRFLKEEGAITIIASHIETKGIENPTLQPVYEYLQKTYTDIGIYFCSDFLNKTEVEKALVKAQNGECILFENIRNAHTGEMSEKDNSIVFAQYIKQFVDFYVQDAFAVSHRAHCSVDALPRLFSAGTKVVGFQLYKEIQGLSDAITPQKPFVCILSGMKFSTKLPLIQKYMHTADYMCIGGALFNNIAKSLGYSIGASLVDSEETYTSTLVKEDMFIKKVFIPQTVTVKDVSTEVVRIANISEVQSTESIQDISVESISLFIDKVESLQTKTIVWNGPVGNYEDERFSKGTVSLGEQLFAYIAKNTEAKLILGGGDTVSAIQHIPMENLQSRIFISTGGGAMLEFLEKEGQLPGIVSLI